MIGKIRNLACCCCGAATRGRQWHNRDTGYGLCDKCAEWLEYDERYLPEEMHRNYGVSGEHYRVEVEK